MQSRFHNFFLLRRPLLPLDTLSIFHQTVGNDPVAFQHEIKALLRQPEIKQAIFLASPELYASAMSLFLEPDQKRALKICQSVYKYLIRMSTRCTPFGMFAGSCLGETSTATQILFNQTDTRKIHTSLDVTVLEALASQIGNRNHIRNQLFFYPNNSLYTACGAIRYIESQNNEECRFSLVELEENPSLNQVLQKAVGGCTVEELVKVLDTEELSGQLALDLIEEMISSQLLVSELDLSATGENFIDILIGKLDRLADAPAELDDLKSLKSVLNSNLSVTDRCKQAENILLDLGISEDTGRPIRADVYFQPETCAINQQVIKTVQKDLSALSSLSEPHSNKMLDQFKKQFVERFQGQQVPLLEAMDQETGIGYGNEQLIGSDDFTLLEDMQLPQPAFTGNILVSSQLGLKMKLYEKALSKNQKQIEITPQDLAEIKVNNIPASDTSEGFYLLGSFLTDSQQSLDRQEFKFVCSAMGGPSSFNLMARFAKYDKVLEGQLIQCIAWEEFSDPDAVFAEINHLPGGRIGNVLMRPHLRKYEIPYLAPSSLANDCQIMPCDILVSINTKNEIILHSKRLGKRIRPRLTNAHNYTTGLPVYRFLCDVAQQQNSCLFNWDWDYLSDCQFLPRVQYQHLILSKATWNLDRSYFDSKNNSNSLAAQWSDICKQLEIPRFVQIVQGDHLLLVDAESEFSVRNLFDTWKSHNKIKLVEYLETPGKGLVKSNGKHYAHEVIIPFLSAVSKPDNLPCSYKTFDNSYKRDFLPGSEWLYFKIYCGAKAADNLLTAHIKPFCDQLLESNEIQKWFFVRYQDPEPHIRLRFHHGSDKHFWVKVKQKLALLLQPFLENKHVHRIIIDTYQRELERYPCLSYHLAESLFYADSTAVMSALQAVKTTDIQRWQLALRSIDLLFDDLQFDVGNKKKFCDHVQKQFFDQLQGNTTLTVQLNNKYRKNRELIEKTMGPAYDSLLQQIDTYFEPRSFLIREWLRRNRKIQKQDLYILASNLIHMHLNRLLISNHTLQEMIVYHFLKKYYDSINSRDKNFDANEKKILINF